MYIPHFVYPFICWWTLGQCISLLRQPEPSTQTGWLKQQKFIFSQFCRLEVQDEGFGWFSFWWGLSSRLADDCFLAMSSHDLFWGCAHSRERVLSLLSFLIRTPIPLGEGPTLMTSFNLNYFLAPNTVSLGLGFQYMNFGGTYTFSP